jgi:hypothetical protein
MMTLLGNIFKKRKKKKKQEIWVAVDEKKGRR